MLMLFPSRKSMGKVVSFVTGGSICSRARASLRGGVGFAESGTPLRTDHLHRFVGLRALGIIAEAIQRPVEPFTYPRGPLGRGHFERKGVRLGPE